jgi:hypothetical protein
MAKQKTITPQKNKQRVTAFLDPILVKRAKVRGALEGLTISEVVERALDEYAPKIEKDANQFINLKFGNSPAINSLLIETGVQRKRAAMKHTNPLVVPR